MYLRLLSLHFKDQIRSSQFFKNIIMSFFTVFMSIYMIVCFFILGYFLENILEKIFPDTTAASAFNHLYFYAILLGIIYRFFMQKFPSMKAFPFLTLPIPKSKLAIFFTAKSLFSINNFSPLVLILPFWVTAPTKDYTPAGAMAWLITLMSFTLIVHLLTFFLERVNFKNKLLSYIIVSLIAVIGVIDGLNWIPLSYWLGTFIDTVGTTPIMCLIPLGIAAVLMWLNIKELKHSLYLDEHKTSTKERKTYELSMFDRWGDIGELLRLELRLIWRNKRTKMQFLASFIMPLYGLLLFSQEKEQPELLVTFMTIMIAGMGAIQYGNLIVAWEGSHFDFITTRVRNWRTYLEAKYVLLTAMVALTGVPSLFYGFFEWELSIYVLSAMLYHIGVNIYIMLIFGSFQSEAIELNASATMNMQGSKGMHFLAIVPLMVVPVGIQFLTSCIFSDMTGYLTLGGIGLVGIILRKPLLNLIHKRYQDARYTLRENFKK